MVHINMSFWDKKEPKGLFQELRFYNTFIKKPRIKCLTNIDLLHELNEVLKKYQKHFKDMQEVIELK